MPLSGHWKKKYPILTGILLPQYCQKPNKVLMLSANEAFSCSSNHPIPPKNQPLKLAGFPACFGPLIFMTMDTNQLGEQIQQQGQWVPAVRAEMANVVVGQENLVDRLLIGLLTNGHVLLEGLPGLAYVLSLRSEGLVRN